MTSDPRRTPAALVIAAARGVRKRASRVPRGVLIATAVLAGLGVAVAAAIGFGGAGTSTTDQADGMPPATAEVTRGTLTQTQQVGGLISYGTPVGLVAQQSSGTLTWIAPEGGIVGLGEPIYRVDGKPTVLIHGSTPAYRTLQKGSTGPDVQQLEESLHELGYTDLTVDQKYDAKTVQAVAEWQQTLGWEPTGTVSPQQVFVHDGDIRVALPGLVPGSRLGGEPNQNVLTYSGATQVATIPLDVEKQHLINKDDPATITLPDGTSVDGVVTSVGKVAQTIEEENETFVTVIVSIKDQDALAGGFDSAPVSLRIVTEVKEDVLMVPITALVAAPDGGYAVEVVQGESASFVPVETGLFAQGMVEVSGEGIAAGTIVGVAT